jgi:hypothetical protein
VPDISPARPATQTLTSQQLNRLTEFAGLSRLRKSMDFIQDLGWRGIEELTD